MNNDRFQVKPVQDYDGAEYLSVYEEGRAEDERMEERTHPLAMLLAMVLVVGLAMGLVGCYLKHDYVPETPQPDAGGDGGDGGDGDPPPECEEGAMRCTDESDLEVCEDETWITEDCHERCRDSLDEFAFSTGCDADADDPCLCEYDIIEGDVDPCYPNDVYCIDDDTAYFCGAEWREVDCEDYCNETYGIDSYSEGCNAEADDPCQCVTDILDGVMASCEPGELVCLDGGTMGVCDDEGHDYVPVLCHEFCRETHGEDWYSNGCNPEAEELCQCEYGMVDGGMIECSPGEVMCMDDMTVGICVEGFGWETQNCEEQCHELYGPDAATDGCNADHPDDPCMCMLPSDSGGDDD